MNDSITMLHQGPSPDALDAVFLRRLAPAQPDAVDVEAEAPEGGRPRQATAAATAPLESGSAARQEEHQAQTDQQRHEPPQSPAWEASPPAEVSGTEARVDQPLVDWLLQTAAPQWVAVAETVEHVVAEGLRVIAVAGGARGEGRTTLVEGLTATLRARGWQVVATSGPLAEAGEELFNGVTDRPVVIVDAGVWFPPGPIRRDRLATLSVGCDAVILVRRAAQPPSPARVAAIEQTGCRLLGEVLTFEEPHHAGT